MASKPASPLPGETNYFRDLEAMLETADMQSSADMPTTQEIYNHFQSLNQQWPSLEGEVASAFPPAFYKSGKRNVVNDPSYISSEGENIEHRVRLTETAEDIHLWHFSIVKHKGDRPAGYRMLDETSGKVEAGRVVATALKGQKERSNDLDSDDYYLQDIEDDHGSTSYPYDDHRSQTTTSSTAIGQSNQASGGILPKKRIAVQINDDYDSTSRSQNFARYSEQTGPPKYSTRNEQSERSLRPDQRMPEAPMYRTASNDASWTANSDDSNKGKRKVSTAHDHRNASGSGRGLLYNKKLKSPDGSLTSRFSRSKGNTSFPNPSDIIDLISDESVQPPEDVKPPKVPGDIPSSSNENFNTTSPSDVDRNLTYSHRSRVIPNGSQPPSTAEADTNGTTLHYPVEFQLYLSFNPRLPGAEPETEFVWWREKSLSTLTKPGLFSKANDRIPARVDLRSLTLKLKLKGDEHPSSQSVLIEANDDGDENFYLFLEKYTQLALADKLETLSVVVFPRWVHSQVQG